MIITILPSSSNFHAVAYNENKVEKGMAELIEIQNFDGIDVEAGYNAGDLQTYLLDYSRRNENVFNAQFHVSVSCKGNEYTHQQLLDIAHMYLKEMGYADDGQPLLVYAHHDTDNNHIHIITSRVAPDGHKIDHNFEKRRSLQVTKKIMEQYTGQKQEPTLNEVAAAALSYKYTTKAQFCAILESQGYECKDNDDKPILHIYKGGEEQGTIPVQLIMQHALKENSPEQKRRRQLRAILKKYRDLSANKEELAAAMKKKFGISLVFIGKKDSPYGYFLVEHKNKTVFKGSEFLSIKELLQFEDTDTRFARITQTIDGLLKDNPELTTKDINRILYRQFGTRIHKGTVSWNGQTLNLKEEVQEQLKRNNRVAMGLPLTPQPYLGHAPSSQNTHQTSVQSRSDNPLDKDGGSGDSNRDYEVNSSMDLDVDDEAHQRMKWRR